MTNRVERETKKVVQERNMEIKTRQDIKERKEEADEQPLSPAARLFHSPEFNCYIISLIGFNCKIDPDVVIKGIKQTFIRHPRVSSILESDGENGKKQRWVRTNVVVEDHIIVPKIEKHKENADMFLENYISDLTTIPMDKSKPLWEVHLLDLKTSDAENVAVIKVHHSVGDGMSIMSLVLACTRKTSNPDELPTLPSHNRKLSAASSSGDSRLMWLPMVLWSVIILILNTVRDVSELVATTLFLKDTETPIKGDYWLGRSKRMRLVHRTISFDDIKLIKNAMKMTVNDVILGVTQAGLSEYLKEKYGEKKSDLQGRKESRRDSNNLPKGIRLRAALPVNIRPATGIQDLADMMAKESNCRWGNWFGFVVFPFSIALHDDPLEYVRRAKAIIDRKKNSFEAVLAFIVGRFIIKSLGVQVAAKLTKRALSNTTMLFSNLIGPIEEISFYGHPITYVAPTVYGNPQALTMHFQSYMNKMTISMAVDPMVISDPHRLFDHLEESIRSMKTVVKKEATPSRLSIYFLNLVEKLF